MPERPRECRRPGAVEAFIELLTAVRAAGSWKAYIRRPHKDVCAVRGLVTKGFLAGDKAKQAKPLYPNGSSQGDSQKEGTYSRFMSKCKVVDTTQMTKEEQDAALRKHAEGGQVGNKPAAAAPKKAAPKKKAEVVESESDSEEEDDESESEPELGSEDDDDDDDDDADEVMPRPKKRAPPRKRGDDSDADKKPAARKKRR